MKECCEMKGFLTFLVLKIISQKNMSGEEISQELKERKGHKPSPGTIYPVLKSLKKKGFIKEVRNRSKMKKYTITNKGRKEIEIAIRKFCVMFYDLKDEFGKCLK